MWTQTSVADGHKFFVVTTLRSKVYWGCGEKGTLEHSWWKCKLVQPQCKTVWSFFTKLKREPPCDPATPLLSVHLKKTKALTWKDMCTLMLTTALFVTGDTDTPYVPINDWMTEQRKFGLCVCACLYVFLHTCKMEYHMTIKMKSCHLQHHGWILRALC